MCVIRVMVGSRAQSRRAPSVLLIGLILLVASHLVGALHGPGFHGPHKPLFPIAGVALQAPAMEPVAIESDHGHGHHHDVHEDTVDHAVDRVRDSSDPDRTAPAPQLVEPVADHPATSASPHVAGPGDGGPSPGGGRSACARHCVWRQ